MWIRRDCAPGSLYSPWTRNCGKYDNTYNFTGDEDTPWRYENDEDEHEGKDDGDDTTGMDDDKQGLDAPT